MVERLSPDFFEEGEPVPGVPGEVSFYERPKKNEVPKKTRLRRFEEADRTLEDIKGEFLQEEYYRKICKGIVELYSGRPAVGLARIQNLFISRGLSLEDDETRNLIDLFNRECRKWVKDLAGSDDPQDRELREEMFRRVLPTSLKKASQERGDMLAANAYEHALSSVYVTPEGVQSVISYMRNRKEELDDKYPHCYGFYFNENLDASDAIDIIECVFSEPGPEGVITELYPIQVKSSELTEKEQETVNRKHQIWTIERLMGYDTPRQEREKIEEMVFSEQEEMALLEFLFQVEEGLWKEEKLSREQKSLFRERFVGIFGPLPEKGMATREQVFEYRRRIEKAKTVLGEYINEKNREQVEEAIRKIDSLLLGPTDVLFRDLSSQDFYEEIRESLKSIRKIISRIVVVNKGTTQEFEKIILAPSPEQHLTEIK